MSQKIGFIGMGEMASALAGGFIRAGKLAPGFLFACDPSREAAERFLKTVGTGAVSPSIAHLLSRSEVVFLCVKPQHMDSVIAELQQIDKDSLASKLFVTIAAGLPIDYYQKSLGEKIRIIRVMPNTPCLVGEAASGFSRGEATTEADAAFVKSLLDTVGIAFELPERLLDAVTGLSGSGPAFVFMIVEALADGGVKMGLPRAVAITLAAQTLRGSAEMVLKTGEHPGALKDKVTSPAGTTIAGVAELEDRGLRGALIAAVEAAARRSAELGK
ncbi:MAG: pyrroline-5-carboxylate reductase [Thermoguttaceae bacterium]